MNNILNNIKIAFFDIDGTLTNNNKIISDANISALKKLKKKNIYIVLVSGRWNNYLLKYAQDIEVVDYIISTQGSCLYDVKKKYILKSETLSPFLVHKLVNYCIKHKLKLILANLDLIEDNLVLLDNIDIYQGIISCKTKDDVKQLSQFIDTEKDLYISYISAPYYQNISKNHYTVNVNLKTTNKGQTINYLLSYLNISKDDSICFGDNINDLSMFDSCNVKVAMDNAASIIKQKATYITLSNDNDGVSYFINKYFN